MEENGNKVYVGRCSLEDGKFVPAKVIPALKSSFFAHNEVEESSSDLEFLENADDFQWIKSSGEISPNAAKVSGSYIGRAFYDGNVIVGRVDVESKQLIGSHRGMTFSLPFYDILSHKSKSS